MDSGSGIKMKKQKRRNDCLRLLDNSYRIDVNSIRINTHNNIIHEVAKVILAYDEIKKGNQVVVEARFKGGGIADILVLDTFKVIEVLHSESLAKARKKVKKYPKELEIELMDTKEVLKWLNIK
jgi:hypothetical protein